MVDETRSQQKFEESPEDDERVSPEPEDTLNTMGLPETVDLPPTKAEEPEETVIGPVEEPDDPRVAETIISADPKTPDGSLEEVKRFGDYELLKEIARGGMGVVWKARQRSLNRLVALKLMLSGQLASAEERQRFNIEAQAAAALDHPGIVPIYEIGEQQGYLYFSMAYIDGTTLQALVDEQALPPEQVANIMLQVTSAVQSAHEKNVIHRDLKPSNILIDQSDVIKVTDFGLARQTNQEDGLTMTGQILGTPAFMAPEQAKGVPEDIGPHTDVYGLGAILYFLLTEKQPFKGKTTYDTIRMVLEETPVPPCDEFPAIPKDLEAICLKAMSKERSDRYASAGELAADLHRFLAGEPTIARRPGLRVKAKRLFKRYRLHTPVPYLLLIVAGLAVWGLLRNPRESAQQNLPSGEVVTRSPTRETIPPPTPRPLSEEEQLQNVLEQFPWTAEVTARPMEGLVARPAKIPGLESWQLLTKRVILPNNITGAADTADVALMDYQGNSYIFDMKQKALVDLLPTIEESTVSRPRYAYAFNSFGDRLFVAQGNGSAQLAHRETGQVFPAQIDSVATGASWFPQGTLVAIAERHSIVVLNLNGYVVGVHSLSDNQLDQQRSPFVHPKGEKIAANLVAGNCQILSLKWEVLHDLKDTRFLCWGPQGERFLVAVNNGTRVETRSLSAPNKPLKQLDIPNGNDMLAGAWSPSGDYLLLGCPEAGITKWHHPTGDTQILRDKSSGFGGVGFSPASENFEEIGWFSADELAYTPVSKLQKYPFAYSYYSTIHSLHYRPNGALLVGCSDGLHRSYSPTLEPSIIHSGGAPAVKPNELYVGWVNEGNTLLRVEKHALHEWNVQGQKIQQMYFEYTGPCLDPRNEVVAYLEKDGATILLNRQGKPVVTYPVIHSNKLHPSFNRDGSQVAIFNEEDETVVVFDRKGTEIMREELNGFIPTGGFPAPINWSADGRYFAFNHSRRAIVIDVQEQVPLFGISARFTSYVAPIWHPTELRVVFAGGTELYSVALSDRDNVKRISRNTGPNLGNLYASLAWSPDGKTIAAGCWTNGQIHLWNAESEQFTHAIQMAPHTSFVMTAEGALHSGQLDEVDDQMIVMMRDPDGKRRLGSYRDLLRVILKAHPELGEPQDGILTSP